MAFLQHSEKSRTTPRRRQAQQAEGGEELREGEEQGKWIL